MGEAGKRRDLAQASAYAVDRDPPRIKEVEPHQGGRIVSHPREAKAAANLLHFLNLSRISPIFFSYEITYHYHLLNISSAVGEFEAIGISKPLLNDVF